MKPATLAFLSSLLLCGCGDSGEKAAGVVQTVGESPQELGAVNVSKDLAPTEAGSRFLREKLAELDAFKDTPEFGQWGFAPAGRFNKWLVAVKEQHGRNRSKEGGFSFDEGVAVGHLLNLGLEYKSTKGRDNDYTRFARAAIVKCAEIPAAPPARERGTM